MKQLAMMILVAAATSVGGIGVAEAQSHGGSGGAHASGGGGSHGGGGWHGGGWHGGGHGHGWHGSYVVYGFGWGWWPGYYYPYYPAYYPGYPYYGDGSPYPYPYDYSAPAYIQQGSPAYTERHFSEGAQYSYYCPDPPGYYPQVPTCAKGWLRVLPPSVPGPAAPAHN